jgi:diamine N-acetyltransferase
MIELKAAENTLRYEGRQEFAVVDGEKVVGVVELFNYDAADMRAEVGLFIEETSRGKGYGKAALVLLLQYCKETLRLHQVVCDVTVDNAASLHLFESLGFSRCGILKEWTATPDGWMDAVRMQVLSFKF